MMGLQYLAGIVRYLVARRGSQTSDIGGGELHLNDFGLSLWAGSNPLLCCVMSGSFPVFAVNSGGQVVAYEPGDWEGVIQGLYLHESRRAPEPVF